MSASMREATAAMPASISARSMDMAHSDQAFEYRIAVDPQIRSRQGGPVGYSAGGVISSVPDLLTWGAALYRDGAVLETDELSAMLI